jgi:serine phosphatase RsbU (regulator of sigma subunit)
MTRTVPIRRSLLGNLVLIVLLLGGAILALTYLGSGRALRRFSQSLIEQTVERTEAQLQGFFDPVVKQLFFMRQWGEAGLLDLDDPTAIDELLQPMMRQYPWITSAMVANDAGRENMLLRIGDRWSGRQTRVDESGGHARWRRWTEGTEPKGSEELIDYDPRKRPWFQGAVASRADGAHWTEPYIFFTTKEPGITASLAFPLGEELRVVGLDVLLTDISRFTTEIKVLTLGRAFVLSEDGRLIGLPGSGRYADAEDFKEDLLKKPAELDAPVARDLSRALLGADARWGRAVRFTSDGEAWWGQVQPFELGGGRLLLISVAVPESDLVGEVQKQRVGIAAITLFVLALGVARVVVLAHRYSRPIEALVHESERMSQGDLEPGDPIVTPVREVHRLTEAHDTMRKGLQTLLKIEDDLRLARRIQQNTFPKTLPLLQGFELDAWSEPADETGGDTYDIIGMGEASLSDQILLSEGEAGRAVLLLADATGHGIGPALSVTQVRAMLRVAVRMSRELAEIAGLINEQLCQDLPPGRFITAWLGALDAREKTLTTFSAGQGPLVHYRATTDEFSAMEADTIPLGLMPSLTATAPTELAMDPGDLFLVFSDGIYESTDPSDEEFGVERTMELIRRHKDAPASEIMKRIREAVEKFTRGAPAADDRTGILIKRA